MREKAIKGRGVLISQNCILEYKETFRRIMEWKPANRCCAFYKGYDNYLNNLTTKRNLIGR